MNTSEVSLTANHNIAISNVRLLHSNLWTPYHNWKRDSKYWNAMIHLEDDDAFEELANICFTIIDKGDWCGGEFHQSRDLVCPSGSDFYPTFITEHNHEGGVVLSLMDNQVQPSVVDADNNPIDEAEGRRIISGALINVLFSAFITRNGEKLFGKLLVVKVVEAGKPISHGPHRIDELNDAFGGGSRTKARKVDNRSAVKDDFDDSIPFATTGYASTRSRRNPLASIREVSW